jgi:hypothetical protein
LAHDVFISYSHDDKPTADAACAMLEGAGIRCWMAPRDVSPDSEWGAAIVEAIDHARVMVLIFSSKANHSSQVSREVQRAVSREVIIVPLRIEPAEPSGSLAYLMSGVHWLDALTPPLEHHLQGLMGSVKAILRPPGLTDDPDPKISEKSNADQASATGNIDLRVLKVPWWGRVDFASVQIKVFIDGKELKTLTPGEILEFSAPIGDHTIVTTHVNHNILGIKKLGGDSAVHVEVKKNERSRLCCGLSFAQKQFNLTQEG